MREYNKGHVTIVMFDYTSTMPIYNNFVECIELQGFCFISLCVLKAGGTLLLSFQSIPMRFTALDGCGAVRCGAVRCGAVHPDAVHCP